MRLLAIGFLVAIYTHIGDAKVVDGFLVRGRGAGLEQYLADATLARGP